MNYWTKVLIACLVAFSSSALDGQIIDSSIVRVTGVYNYEEQPIKMTMEFSLEENGTSCGPNSQFSSIDEQYSYLLDSLRYDSKITSRIKEIDRLANYSNSNPKRTYSFETENMEECKILRKHAEYAFARNFEYFHHYESSKLEDQDLIAIKALEDAEIKIKEIVKNTNTNSYKLIAIDDNTDSGYSRGLRMKYEDNKVRVKDTWSRQKSYYLHVYYKLDRN